MYVTDIKICKSFTLYNIIFFNCILIFISLVAVELHITLLPCFTTDRPFQNQWIYLSWWGCGIRYEFDKNEGLKSIALILSMVIRWCIPQISKLWYDYSVFSCTKSCLGRCLYIIGNNNESIPWRIVTKYSPEICINSQRISSTRYVYGNVYLQFLLINNVIHFWKIDINLKYLSNRQGYTVWIIDISHCFIWYIGQDWSCAEFELS